MSNSGKEKQQLESLREFQKKLKASAWNDSGLCIDPDVDEMADELAALLAQAPSPAPFPNTALSEAMHFISLAKAELPKDKHAAQFLADAMTWLGKAQREISELAAQQPAPEGEAVCPKCGKLNWHGEDDSAWFNRDKICHCSAAPAQQGRLSEEQVDGSRKGNGAMNYLKIWHREKHSGVTVSEIHNTPIRNIIDAGGFFDPKSNAFILLHNINWIEVMPPLAQCRKGRGNERAESNSHRSGV